MIASEFRGMIMSLAVSEGSESGGRTRGVIPGFGGGIRSLFGVGWNAVRESIR
jgi:hypothetical protein